MRSPPRNRKDQNSRGDIRDRLQALAKSGGGRGSGNNQGRKFGRNNEEDRNRKDKNSKNDSMGRVMERARTEGGPHWTRKLLDEEAKNPERWGHSGFKELYKSELGIKSRRSRSREKMNKRSRSRSKSRDRSIRQHRERDYDREPSNDRRNRLRSDSRDYGDATRRDSAKNSAGNRGKKRSLSSSDRSAVGETSRWPSSSYRSRANDSKSSKEPNQQRQTTKHFKTTNRSDVKDNKGRKSNIELGTSSRLASKSRVLERRRDAPSKERIQVKKRSVSRSRSPSPAASASPVYHSKNKRHVAVSSKIKRGPSSPPERSPLSRSSGSPLHSRRSLSPSDRSSLSPSSSSRSRTSQSRSSSSSSDYSNSSRSSHGHSTVQHSTPPAAHHKAAKNSKVSSYPSKKNASSHAGSSKHATDQVKYAVKKSNTDRSRASTKKHLKTRTTRSDSDATSNPNSSSESDEEIEEGEDDGDDQEMDSPDKSLDPAPRLSLSERFGKLAQLSSQRRSLELVQLRIVAPVGSNNEKNVSVDESSAAPVITKVAKERSRSLESQPPIRINHSPEEMTRIEERGKQRDDRWRDWHERYDEYRHVQPPRQLPRDWGDIRVRHKYYTDRGYFGRDMTLEELSRWENWWHRYQLWRQGYERAWAAAHGPHVPVEYPDWSNYRSTYSRENPVGMAPGSGAGSIRNRLGWRR